MKKPATLSRRGGELLLRLLEQRNPVVTAAALEEYLPDARLRLVALGALELHGTARSTIVAGDEGPTFREIIRQADRDANGYFDGADGVVSVAPDDQKLLRVSSRWWLAWLANALDLTNCSQPTEIVAGHAWDVGDLWIDRRRKIPVIFARRLHRDETCQALADALKKRSGRGGPLVLTSSRNPPSSLEPGLTLVLVSLLAVLTNDADDFGLDRDLLLSPYVSRKPAPNDPLHLSPDGRQLIINGDVIINFKSDIHVAVVRKLVQGFKDGKRYSARELLDHSQSGAKTLRQAFGHQRWAELEPYLKSENGLWGFDL